MGVAKDLFKFVASPITALLGGQPKAPTPLPQPTVDQAAQRAAQQDVLSARRGAGADMLLGAAGAESTQGKKTALGT